MSTPADIASSLQAAGWHQVEPDYWQRPGAHPDLHSYLVAEFVQRTGEPHHAIPALYRACGVAEAGADALAEQAPRIGAPRKVDLIRKVASMRDGQGMSFDAIAEAIGGAATRARYLYRQAEKINDSPSAIAPAQPWN